MVKALASLVVTRAYLLPSNLPFARARRFIPDVSGCDNAASLRLSLSAFAFEIVSPQV